MRPIEPSKLSKFDCLSTCKPQNKIKSMNQTKQKQQRRTHTRSSRSSSSKTTPIATTTNNNNKQQLTTPPTTHTVLAFVCVGATRVAFQRPRGEQVRCLSLLFFVRFFAFGAHFCAILSYGWVCGPQKIH